MMPEDIFYVKVVQKWNELPSTAVLDKTVASFKVRLEGHYVVMVQSIEALIDHLSSTGKMSSSLSVLSRVRSMVTFSYIASHGCFHINFCVLRTKLLQV